MIRFRRRLRLERLSQRAIFLLQGCVLRLQGGAPLLQCGQLCGGLVLRRLRLLQFAAQLLQLLLCLLQLSAQLCKLTVVPGVGVLDVVYHILPVESMKRAAEILRLCHSPASCTLREGNPAFF